MTADNLNIDPEKCERSKEDDDIEFDELTPPLPPDGGWGWAVVIAALFCNIIVDGVTFTFGIFYVELLDYFKESKGKTAWVGSLLPGMYLGMGPIVGALANRYGCRVVTIIGAIVAAVSFFISTFSPNVNVLIITYGVMGGIGFGLMYLPSIVIVGFYFEKKRAFATGLAVCGTGIGTFIFAPLGRYLLDLYGWKGGNWIIAGIILNGIICGAIFRPLTAQRPKKSKKRDLTEAEIQPKKSIIMQKIMEEKKRQRTISTGSLDGTVITKENKLIKDPKAIKNMKLAMLAEESNEQLDQLGSAPCLSGSTTKVEFSDDQQIDQSNDFQTPTIGTPLLPESSRSMGSLTEKLGPSHKVVERLRAEASGSSSHLHSRKQSTTAGSINALWKSGELTSKQSLEEVRKEMSRPLYRQDIFYSGSVASIPEFKSNPNMASYVQSTTSVPLSIMGSMSNCAPLCYTFKSMVDFSLFRSLTFIMLCITSTLAMLGFFTPFVYITPKALSVGIDPQKAALLLSVLGVFNTLGRVVSGWVSDRPWADCILIHNMSLILAGAFTCVVPFLESYYLLCIYCALFGCCIAAFIALRSIVLVELLGLQMLTTSFGLVLLFQGIASVIGSPLAGMMFDATQSYKTSFLLAGGLIFVAGLICLPVRRVAAWERSHNRDFLASEKLGSEYVKVSQRSEHESSI